MRPLRLEIKNLTSLRNPEPIDFTGLDLFAIWGPTGAGKSSIVDAITFALFGQVPRVGRGVKELISQNEDRMSVSFEFSSGSDRYRVHRSTSNRGASPVQLDRLRSGGTEWETVADRAADVTAEIEKVLRMDYGAFIRSVLLPQGEFDRFLSGDRDERRRIIDGLLQLGIYAEMHRRANAIDSQHTGDADRIKQRLESELADATPDALRAAKAALGDRETRARELQAIRDTAAAAERSARLLADAGEREKAARVALAEAKKGVEAAARLLAGGQNTIKDLDARIAALQAEARTTNYDSAVHLRLSQCLPLLREVESLAVRAKEIEDDIASSEKALAKLSAAAEAAEARHHGAQIEAKTRRDEYVEVQRNNAASFLVQDLKPGDPCPICGQPVGKVELVAHRDFARVKAASEASQQAEKDAQTALNGARNDVALKKQEIANAAKQFALLREDASTREADAAKLLPEPGLSAKDIEARIAALDVAKSRLEKLESDERALRTQRDTAAEELSSAQAGVMRLEAEARTHEAASSQACEDASLAAADLAACANDLAWDDVAAALAAGDDPTPLIQRRLHGIREEDATVQREIGGQKARIEQIERDIDRARDLREQEKSLRESSALARDLASLLRTNNFPTFIREQALRTLAGDGTRHLNEVSRGRFDFQVDGQDFYVLDRWNGGERRSVKTLSGGETFLASLALALALADQLPGLAGDTAGRALESLFIDEGFSNLDAETLDVVANALEAIGQGGNRLVGVVTHLPALAERMPARITVHKSQAGSTVTID